MAKRCYIGVDSKARRVKKIYASIDGKARKVKKGYIGVNGIARKFFSSGELVYYGTATSLQNARSALAATTIGDYALFGGGYGNGPKTSSPVDAYSRSLVRSTLDTLSTQATYLAATTIGDYALFGGGGNFNSTVDVYNNSLVHSTATNLSAGRTELAATTIGNYALFGGGSTGSPSDIVDAYNNSLVHSTPTQLSAATYTSTATSNNNYALFGGGEIARTYDSNGATNYHFTSTVNAYNSLLTKITTTSLSTAREQMAATMVGNYALFGGGSINIKESNATTTQTTYSYVDAYSSSLSRSTTTLSTARYNLAATVIGDYALFGGGYGSTPSAIVDAYDTSLTRSSPTSLSTARYNLAATTVGDYALFGGGSDSSGNSAVVDVYTID